MIPCKLHDLHPFLFVLPWGPAHVCWEAISFTRQHLGRHVGPRPPSSWAPRSSCGLHWSPKNMNGPVPKSFTDIYIYVHMSIYLSIYLSMYMYKCIHIIIVHHRIGLRESHKGNPFDSWPTCSQENPVILHGQGAGQWTL